MRFRMTIKFEADSDVDLLDVLTGKKAGQVNRKARDLLSALGEHVVNTPGAEDKPGELCGRVEEILIKVEHYPSLANLAVDPAQPQEPSSATPQPG